MSPRILFLGHDASRSGAPIALLHILRWLTANSDFKVGIVLLRGGDLEEEFAKHGLVHCAKPPAEASMPRKIGRKLLRRPAQGDDPTGATALLRAATIFAPHLIYANTAVSTVFAAHHRLNDGVPLICHLHELSYAVETLVGHSAFTSASAHVDHFICVANMARQDLIHRHGVNEERISIVREPIATNGTPLMPETVRSELGIPRDCCLVLGSGTASWHKGLDLFVLTARLVNDAVPGTHFVWVGHVDRKTELMLKHDVERLRLDGLVQFVGAKAQPDRYMAAADIFFLPSREDSYPLVCLEAAYQGKPIVCFERAGGIPEFVRDDAGRVVPYLDLARAAAAILALGANAGLRVALGSCGRERALRESAIEVIGPQIQAVITNVLASSAPRLRA